MLEFRQLAGGAGLLPLAKVTRELVDRRVGGPAGTAYAFPLAIAMPSQCVSSTGSAVVQLNACIIRQ